MAHADTLREIEGPLPVLPTLIASAEPVALLERMVAAGDLWRKAAGGWHASEKRSA